MVGDARRFVMYFLWFVAGLFGGYLWMAHAYGLFN